VPTVLTLTPAGSTVLVSTPAEPGTFPSLHTFPSAGLFPSGGLQVPLTLTPAISTPLTLTAA
jgi:hypothetical protein